MTLTQQESRIASLVADGYSNQQIAQSLGLSEGTVNNYLTGLYAKVATDPRRNQRVQLAKWVWQNS